MKYPHNQKPIPALSTQAPRSPQWLQEIDTYIAAMCDYADNVSESQDHPKIKLSYAGALVYIHAFASTIEILSQHYDELPTVYFDLFDTARNIVDKTDPKNRDNKTDKAWCTKETMLIFQIKADKQLQYSEKDREIALEYYEKIKQTSKSASTKSHEEYLPHLCNQLAKRARIDSVKNAFYNLARAYKTKTQSNNIVVTTTPDKKHPYNLRKRKTGSSSSPEFFKESKDPNNKAPTATQKQTSSGCGLL
ncbi:MAG: hypothetical protein KAS93_01170 [Gammaproteobacteria bacterium]|nr:hypothetical protein [Gammaproteobacteria bacterium]